MTDSACWTKEPPTKRGLGWNANPWVISFKGNGKKFQ